ncbi:MAG: SH3 domain-containing protein [Dehalococcoidia bacterium]|nr:SH3 domain-containing protein [Dehalococcoidia bacterium]
MKQKDNRMHSRQDRKDVGRHHRTETLDPVPDPVHAVESDTPAIGETTFRPRADRHAALLSPPCSDVQRTGVMLHLQRTYGNSYVQRLLSSLPIQGEMTVSAPDDIYEQEANEVVGTVTRAISYQAQCQEEEEELQIKPASAVQRQDETPEPDDPASRRRALSKRLIASSPLPPEVRRIGRGLISIGQSARRPDLIEYGHEFLRTGQLRLLSLRTNVMVKPQFVGVSVQHLKRGAMVTVLDTDGSWYRVRTDEGTEGWVHSRGFLPQAVRLRSGPTGSGSTRGEQEHAGRG